MPSEKWDECPECGMVLALVEIWRDCDYADEFSCECPECHASLSVVTEFTVSVEKKESEA